MKERNQANQKIIKEIIAYLSKTENSFVASVLSTK
jgi:hypothetical protein